MDVVFKELSLIDKNWWLQSSVVSVVLACVLMFMWSEMNHYTVLPPQLTHNEAVSSYLNDHWSGLKGGQENGAPTERLKTGLFIQSLYFNNSTEVNITGYLWQKYDNRTQAEFIPKVGEVGFIFPEQVSTQNNPIEKYRIVEGDDTLVGWYFETIVKQPFDYSLYPFDHKTVWLRIWPKDFSKNVILVPDFNAYEKTGVNDVFGIDEDIVLGTWERENTYFDYYLSSYNTNFGIDDYVGQSNFPELRYNVVIKRKFQNAFIIYLLPLLLVAILLYSALLTVSDDNELFEKFGSNVTGFIGGCSALFFVVMLAHIQLREQFSGSSIVYIEYFYILMYVMLVVATANTYLFSVRSQVFNGLVLYRDNMIPKVLYWPSVLSALIAITYFVTYGD